MVVMPGSSSKNRLRPARLKSGLSGVGASLLWTLEKGLGRAFTPELKEAWATVYGMLATVMIDAMRSETEAA